VSFNELGLVPPLLQAIAEAGYEQPTPIQRDAIPPALAGRDLLGCAQTGTGKTAAFSLPILQRINENAGDDPAIRALILTPTRELAAQIYESLRTYGKHLELWHAVIFGGVPEKPQIAELRRGIDVLVATPGRLLDLMNRGLVDLRSLEIFVLDEADQMLDMGFMPDVRRIVKALPVKRQTLMFSATMPDPIRELAEGLLDNPVSVAVARISQPIEAIDQRLYFVDTANKRQLIVELLNGRGPDRIERALVFSRTKHGANRIATHLSKAGISAAAIHGNKSQNARTKALDEFKRGHTRVLVATDIAARGIDIDAVSHVINFDLPNVPETYVHRIGRTARAGASGVAMSFCDGEERAYLVDIERLIGRHIDRVEDHGYPSANKPPAPTDLARKGGGSGSGGKPAARSPRPSGGGQPSRQGQAARPGQAPRQGQPSGRGGQRRQAARR
jgi:ATP-dependent RNA helicase RhlE